MPFASTPAKIAGCLNAASISAGRHTTPIGNAEEASDWAAHRRYRRLIVVTSSYHMPRTLTEFARAMPHVRLIAHPVLSRNVRDHAWWQSPGTLRFLFSEYVKFIAATARLGWTRAHLRSSATVAARR